MQDGVYHSALASTRTGRTETRSSLGRRGRSTDKSAALNSQPVNNYGISACERLGINLCPHCDIVLPLCDSGYTGRHINIRRVRVRVTCKEHRYCYDASVFTVSFIHMFQQLLNTYLFFNIHILTVFSESIKK